MYSGALNSEYDALSNTEMDALFPEGGDASTEEELCSIRDNLILNAEAFTIDHALEGRSTATLTIKDATGAFKFSERQQFEYTDLDGNPDYAGIVASCQETRIPGTDYVFHSLDSCDYTAVLDWRVCTYTSPTIGVFAGDVVKALLSTYLAEEGITAGTIEDGQYLTQVVISNKTIMTAMQKLAETSNFIFYINYDLTLNFHARSLNVADWQIVDGSEILADSMIVTRNNPLYRNIENVVGGYQETDLQTETILGDGVTQSFAVGYSINRIQDVYWTPLVGVVVHPTIGIKGSTTAYGFEYAVGSETVRFNTILPPAGSTITIEYFGLWKVQTKVQDIDLIAENKARMGFGSGKVEHVFIEESLTSADAATEYGNAKISEYGSDGIVVSYKTITPGLEVGTLQSIDIFGLDTETDGFLITRVSQDSSDSFTTYNVEAVSGPVNEDWEHFFMSQLTTQLTISEGQDSGAGAAFLLDYENTYYNADRPDPFARTLCDGPAVSATTWPSFGASDRANYIEFWDAGHQVIARKPHTIVNDISSQVEYTSYSFFGPAEGNGAVAHVVFYGGSSATAENGTGVVLYNKSINFTKTMLGSYQVNMRYIHGVG